MDSDEMHGYGRNDNDDGYETIQDLRKELEKYKAKEREENNKAIRKAMNPDNVRKRLPKDLYYLTIARSVLLRATCLRRKFGAVIVNNDKIVSTGFNGAPRGEEDCLERGYCERDKLKIPHGERYELCRAVHAEQNAMLHAGRDACVGGTVYLCCYNLATDKVENFSICLICERMLKNAGIERAVIANSDPWKFEEKFFKDVEERPLRTVGNFIGGSEIDTFHIDYFQTVRF
jgi:dCMP deaminase